ncbi:hypothetical protein SKAU_G00213340 [Synaphobranchus kaupii]|uniref:Uncharacterized protein n=1 Tax=Synaphobranchus kaupii TaxID=118154 RepID=A0A9Q1F9K5_SYNKA|nr:hypothetical protein SKAU_G00213340 [Synaphobranchus kaupii]
MACSGGAWCSVCSGRRHEESGLTARSLFRRPATLGPHRQSRQAIRCHGDGGGSAAWRGRMSSAGRSGRRTGGGGRGLVVSGTEILCSCPELCCAEHVAERPGQCHSQKGGPAQPRSAGERYRMQPLGFAATHPFHCGGLVLSDWVNRAVLSQCDQPVGADRLCLVARAGMGRAALPEHPTVPASPTVRVHAVLKERRRTQCERSVPRVGKKSLPAAPLSDIQAPARCSVLSPSPNVGRKASAADLRSELSAVTASCRRGMGTTRGEERR